MAMAIPWRMMTASLLVAGVAACSTAPKPPAQVTRGDYSSITPYLAERVRYEMKAAGVQGASFALVDDQKIVWAEGFGYADPEKKIPARADTIYRAGSISKLFTATLAMQLAEQGKLDIDAPIQRYLPDFNPPNRFASQAPITARNLMTHHAGLPSDYLAGTYFLRPQPDTHLPTGAYREPLTAPPDHQFSYSNLGYWALGETTARIAGQDFAQLAQTALLQPLGMKRSYFAQGIEPDGGSALSPASQNLIQAENLSREYLDGKKPDEKFIAPLPAGGLNTTAEDLAQLVKMIFADGSINGKQIIQPTTLASMLKPQTASLPMDRDTIPQMGLGWRLGKVFAQGEPTASHSGGIATYSSMLQTLPRHKLGIIMLTHSAEGDPASLEQMLDEFLALAVEVKTGEQPQAIHPTPAGTPQAWTESEMQALVGAYGTLFGYVKIVRDGDALYAETDDERLELIKRQDGAIGLRKKLLGMIPVGTDFFGRISLSIDKREGKDIVLVKSLKKHQNVIVGQKIQPSPTPAAWRARLGEYVLDTPSDSTIQPTRLELLEQDGLLLARLTTKERGEEDTLTMALQAVSDDMAAIPVTLVSSSSFQTVRASDGTERLLYSGFSFRRQAAQAGK